MKHLPDVEVAVLHRVHRRDHRLPDEGGPAVEAYKPGRVVPVAQAEPHLAPDVLQVLDEGAAGPGGVPAVEAAARPAPRLQPGDTLVQQAAGGEVLRHRAAPEQLGELGVCHALPLQHELVGPKPLAGRALRHVEILQCGVGRDGGEIGQQVRLGAQLVAQERDGWGRPEEVEAADAALWNAVQLSVGLHDGERVAVRLSDLPELLQQWLSGPGEQGWGVLPPVNLWADPAQRVLCALHQPLVLGSVHPAAALPALGRIQHGEAAARADGGEEVQASRVESLPLAAVQTDEWDLRPVPLEVGLVLPELGVGEVEDGQATGGALAPNSATAYERYESCPAQGASGRLWW